MISINNNSYDAHTKTHYVFNEEIYFNENLRITYQRKTKKNWFFRDINYIEITFEQAWKEQWIRNYKRSKIRIDDNNEYVFDDAVKYLLECLDNHRLTRMRYYKIIHAIPKSTTDVGLMYYEKIFGEDKRLNENENLSNYYKFVKKGNT